MSAVIGPQLRYELVRAGTPAASASGGESRSLLEHPILLDPAEQYLMRCDRVDFDLGGRGAPAPSCVNHEIIQR